MRNLTEHLSIEHSNFADGGFGALCRATLSIDPGNSPDPVHVAVKFPTVRLVGGTSISKLADCWNCEVRVLDEKCVEHPNVLPFLGICDNPDPHYRELPGIVLPYCVHGNAWNYLADHPQVDRLHFLCGAASALFALHSAARLVIHGDIKATNMLVGDKRRALLADFGLSHISGTRGFTTESILGTCRYMAIEMLMAMSKNEPIRTTTASDVWAFAMTILEIITMQPAFANMNSGAVFLQVITKGARPERPAEATNAIWSLLERYWEEDPSARPSARQIGLVLDLTYGCALNDDDVHMVSGVLGGTWDAVVPYRKNSRISDSSLPYTCKWLHCPRSYATMEECIEHEFAKLTRRRPVIL